MKTKQNQLNVILKKFDVETFYHVGFTQNSISLQAKYSSSLILKIREYFKTELAEYKEEIGSNGFITIHADDVRIALTE